MDTYTSYGRKNNESLKRWRKARKILFESGLSSYRDYERRKRGLTAKGCVDFYLPKYDLAILFKYHELKKELEDNGHKVLLMFEGDGAEKVKEALRI